MCRELVTGAPGAVKGLSGEGPWEVGRTGRVAQAGISTLYIFRLLNQLELNILSAHIIGLNSSINGSIYSVNNYIICMQLYQGILNIYTHLAFYCTG